ncbi:MAG: hypothetical protein II809_01445, partial [Bacteroidales bacterium]|nr:hypothetical protein [Bacteroidales bacterium]
MYVAINSNSAILVSTILAESRDASQASSTQTPPHSEVRKNFITASFALIRPETTVVTNRKHINAKATASHIQDPPTPGLIHPVSISVVNSPKRLEKEAKPTRRVTMGMMYFLAFLMTIQICIAPS